MNLPGPSEVKLQPAESPEADALFLRNLHWGFTILTALGAALCIAWRHIAAADALDSPWPNILFLISATISLALGLGRQLPTPNVLGALGVVLVFGVGVQMLGAGTSLPFGPFNFNRDLDRQIFDLVPLPAPLIWVALIFSARGVVRLILRPWRKMNNYGFWLIGLTALLVLLTDFALEPFATQTHHYWIWTHTKLPLTWYGAPAVNFLAWGFVALLMLAFITPMLINKQLSRKNIPDHHPLGTWLAIMVVITAAMVEDKLWPAVVVNGIVILVTTAFAIRGARW